MGIAESKLRDGGRLRDIRAFIDELYAHDLHAKRVDSLSHRVCRATTLI